MLTVSSALLRDEVSARLSDFKSSLEVTVREAHQLQGPKWRVFLEPSEPCSPVWNRDRSSNRLLSTPSSRKLGQSVLSTLTGISQLQKAEMQDLKATVDPRLSTIQFENEKKLDQMRQTVDEKLQGTLEARLGESFRQVSERSGAGLFGARRDENAG